MSPRRDEPLLLLMGSREAVSLPSTKAENHSTCMKASAGPALRRRAAAWWRSSRGCGSPDTHSHWPPHPSSARGASRKFCLLPSAIQQAGMGDTQGGTLPNDGQGSEVPAGTACPPQGLVWLAEAAGPQGSAFGAAGPELGRASIKSNRVVCCGWEPGF